MSKLSHIPVNVWVQRSEAYEGFFVADSMSLPGYEPFLVYARSEAMAIAFCLDKLSEQLKDHARRAHAADNMCCRDMLGLPGAIRTLTDILKRDDDA